MPKEIDVASLPTESLRALIQNHRDKGATDRPAYISAIRELEARTGRGLDFDKSFEIIRQAAQERRFLSYKDLADASGAAWSKVHYEVGGHLGRLVEYAHRKGWPMLSAIVVNKANLSTGQMEPETLQGFVKAASELGHTVTDREAFLRQQQDAVFTWGAGLP